jgi:phosphoglycerol transferase
MSLIKRSQPMRAPIRSRMIPPFWRETSWAVATAIVALLVAWQTLGFSYLRIDVPVVATGDASQFQYLIESNRENGWYQPITRAGSPFGTSHTDLPNADGFSLLLTRALGLVVDSPFAIYNLYLLAGFALCALIGYAVYRRLGLSAVWAAVASLAFTWLPFHFQRIGQPFLTLYFSAALAGWLALEVISGSAGNASKTRAGRGLVILAAILCGISGTYYAFFTCLVVGAAGLCAMAKSGSVLPLRRTAIVIAIIVAATATNLIPSRWHVWTEGGNTEITGYQPADSETLGLKLTQLLLPRQAHRADSMAHFRSGYDQSAPLSNENATSSLGLIGAAGFLLLLVIPFLGHWRERLPVVVRDASGPTYAAFLYATIGGFGSLFALLISPQLRAVNRISPFIAFFAILVSATVLNALVDRWKDRRYARWISSIAPLLVLAFCVFDQTGPGGRSWEPVHQAQTAKFEGDQRFFRAIEQAVPAQSMILQLPLASYPENPAQPYPLGFAPLDAYLHTSSLRWSFGAMRGRAEERWQRLLEAFPLPAQIEALATIGFAGIHIDRRGYPDQGAAVDAGLVQAGMKPSLQSEDILHAFYPFTNVKNPRYRAYAVAPDRGWSAVESNSDDVWLWSTGNASLLLANHGGIARECYLELTLESFAVPRTITLQEGTKKLVEHTLKPGIPTQFSAYLDSSEGHRKLDLLTDQAALSPGAGDSRLLAFRMIMRKPPLCR